MQQACEIGARRRDVLGKYHPHGDSSRMRRWCGWRRILRCGILVDGQGNFGSRDGDNAAAMRYTERGSRRLPICCCPSWTWARWISFPTMTAHSRNRNAACAPADGVAQRRIRHCGGHGDRDSFANNLKEVAKAGVMLAKNPNLKDDKLMSYISGPDFPGGGQIISSDADIAMPTPRDAAR